MSLGAAFQKVNFLRDFKADYEHLGRVYFPDVNFKNFSEMEKAKIENEIEADFNNALIGIKQLPRKSKKGVYLAYIYYLHLLKKIKRVPAQRILYERIRIPNSVKLGLMLRSIVSYRLNTL